jgi:hypothetical protein
MAVFLKTFHVFGAKKWREDGSNKFWCLENSLSLGTPVLLSEDVEGIHVLAFEHSLQ